MKSLWLMIALASVASVPTFARAAIKPHAPVLQCNDADHARGSCVILPLGGQAVEVANLRLLFVDLEDNRCPLDVDCFWAGYVNTTLVVESPKLGIPLQYVELSLDPREELSHVWVNDAAGLTVILEDVSRTESAENASVSHRGAKVIVGRNLSPSPNL
ncbi:MAG TPA: hypothetical protein VE954_26155 [Oligoflexus sp.]|uniref:hypothetical protein n=1 Tax=Oligoflexus sp. TaxID=1971216 RepID=UPI002D6A8938|nr:hypothetical protein [Oligoflexus sp.]HYX36608.1 hypothetical protein [Oligoflexus sp.]